MCTSRLMPSALDSRPIAANDGSCEPVSNRAITGGNGKV